jgi:hypothetical protein
MPRKGGNRKNSLPLKAWVAPGVEVLFVSLEHPHDFFASRRAVIKTRHHDDYKQDWRMKMADVAMATSAAPTIYRALPTEG